MTAAAVAISKPEVAKFAPPELVVRVTGDRVTGIRCSSRLCDEYESVGLNTRLCVCVSLGGKNLFLVTGYSYRLLGALFSTQIV